MFDQEFTLTHLTTREGKSIVNQQWQDCGAGTQISGFRLQLRASKFFGSGFNL